MIDDWVKPSLVERANLFQFCLIEQGDELTGQTITLRIF